MIVSDFLVDDFKKIQEFVSKKHNLAVIRALLSSVQGIGFNALLKITQPITPRILSLRLKDLEKQKIIQKNLVLGMRPKIEYRLLPKGEKLKKTLIELEKWGKQEL